MTDHKSVGARLNNAVWEALESGQVTESSDLIAREDLLYAAYASTYHWSQAGTVANRARGEHLIARVAARVGLAERALHHALRCLALVEAHPTPWRTGTWPSPWRRSPAPRRRSVKWRRPGRPSPVPGRRWTGSKTRTTEPSSKSSFAGSRGSGSNRPEGAGPFLNVGFTPDVELIRSYNTKEEPQLMRARTGLLGVATALLTIASPLTAGAQEVSPITITSPYPGVVAEPGDTASFPLVVNAAEPRTVELAVTGLPTDWTATLRGGGQDIRRVTATPDGQASNSIELDVTVPLDAPDGAHAFAVEAHAGELTATLDLEVMVSAEAGGEVTLLPEFPALRGPSDATFSFTVEVTNQMAEEVQLELAASGPAGWRVDARPTAENQASTLTVESGATQRVTVEARPPVTVEAGDYEVVFQARGTGVDAEVPLAVRITGDVSLEISTPDQRLNASVTTGEPTVIPVLVVNTGTSPLNGVELRSTAPRNWEVGFEPEAISSLAAGEAVTVNATVTPATDALAGDYRVTFRASVDQAADSIEIRTTVEPSTVWGLIGVGVIALTLGGLAGVFHRFGRR